MASSSQSLCTPLLAEFIGTFLLVFIGCGAIVDYGWAAAAVDGIAFSFGLTYMVCMTVFGPISGCHLNPAVSIAMFTVGKMELKQTVAYIITQCFAAIAAVGSLMGISSGLKPGSTWGYAVVNPQISPFQGCCVEFLATFVFVFILFGVNYEQQNVIERPLILGLTIVALMSWAGPITACCINPARVFGPCVVLWLFQNHWVYWLGPVLGAITAALLYENVFHIITQAELEENERLVLAEAAKQKAKREHKQFLDRIRPHVDDSEQPDAYSMSKRNNKEHFALEFVHRMDFTVGRLGENDFDIDTYSEDFFRLRQQAPTETWDEDNTTYVKMLGY